MVASNWFLSMYTLLNLFLFFVQGIASICDFVFRTGIEFCWTCKIIITSRRRSSWCSLDELHRSKLDEQASNSSIGRLAYTRGINSFSFLLMIFQSEFFILWKRNPEEAFREWWFTLATGFGQIHGTMACFSFYCELGFMDLSRLALTNVRKICSLAAPKHERLERFWRCQSASAHLSAFVRRSRMHYMMIIMIY